MEAEKACLFKCDLCFVSEIWSYFNMDINKVSNLHSYDTCSIFGDTF